VNKPTHSYNFSVALVLTLFVVGLIGFAIYDLSHWPFILALCTLVGISFWFFNRTFSCSRFFVFAFVNGISVYAYGFRLMLDTSFPAVAEPLPEIGFSIPIIAYLVGSWVKRKAIKETLKDGGLAAFPIRAAFVWLALMLAGGLGTIILLSQFPVINNMEVLFALLIAAIAMMTFLVSAKITLLLLDTGLMFEEFFERVKVTASAAFAFLTFYSLTVIFFAAVYRLLDFVSPNMNFMKGGVAGRLDPLESIYFSVATLTTVGYGDITPHSPIARITTTFEVVFGVILLLYGFSEIMSYARERAKDKK
jgi:voltage-gated potassium channel